MLDELAQEHGSGELSADVNLLENGVVDSHGLMEVIAFLEQRYGIAIADDDLVPENFESLAQIEAFVVRKTA